MLTSHNSHITVTDNSRKKPFPLVLIPEPFPHLSLQSHTHNHTQIRTKLKLFLFGLCLSVSVSLSLSLCLSLSLSAYLSVCLSLSVSLSLFVCLSLNLSLSHWFESHKQISFLFDCKDLRARKKELKKCPFVCQSCHVENFENFLPFCSWKRDRERELFLVPKNRWREVFGNCFHKNLGNCFHENLGNCQEMTGKLWCLVQTKGFKKIYLDLLVKSFSLWGYKRVFWKNGIWIWKWNIELAWV
jgi:hypothetical protein